jgi:hypothetical protein
MSLNGYSIKEVSFQSNFNIEHDSLKLCREHDLPPSFVPPSVVCTD